MSTAVDDPPAAAGKQLLLVVGVGRSGTSLCTGVLGQLGFRVPQPEVSADETNPRGFSEPKWVVDFHRRLMSSRRVSVFDSRPAAWTETEQAGADDEVYQQLRSWLAVQFVGSDAVVVKDPRIGWFLPTWIRCAHDVGAVPATITMLRHPAEILSSARRSYGTWQNDASRATSWVNGMLGAERQTRGTPRAFLRYESLLGDWPRAIARAGERLDIPSLARVDAEPHPEIDAFIDPTLHRVRAGWAESSVPASVEALAERAWSALTPLTEDGQDPTALAALDGLREEYDAFYAEAEAIAQSSVTAVRPSKKAAAAAGRRGGAATATSPTASRPSVRRRTGALASRAARVVPMSLRKKVPISLRRRVARALARSGRSSR